MRDSRRSPGNYRRQAKKRSDQYKLKDDAMWEELPDDLWEAIFSGLHHCHLKEVSLVCKRFLSLSNRTVTDFSFFPNDSPLIPLPHFFSRFTLINTIDLYDPDPNLDLTITQLASSNLPLKSLTLSHQTHFPKEAMGLLGRSMAKTLRSLSCMEFHVMGDDDLAVVAIYFPYLHKLNIQSSGSKITFRLNKRKQDVGAGITDEGILKISTKLKSLVALNILYLYNLSHRSFEYLASNCSVLRELSADFNGYSCNACLNLFVSLGNLTVLELKGKKISKGALEHLFQANLKLEKLSLCYYQSTKDFNGAFFSQFLKSLGHLRHLVLNSAMFPLDMNAIDFTASIPSIEAINLFDHPWLDHSIPPGTLFYLLKNCQSLQGIYIGGNLQTRRQDWLNIPVRHSMGRLSLECCEDLSHGTLKRIVSICPKLYSLSIKDSLHITEKGVKAVIRRYSNIKLYNSKSIS